MLEAKVNTNEEELLKIKGDDTYIDGYDLHMKNIEDFSQLKSDLKRFNSNNVKERVIKSVKDYHI